jgi:hypothetical protein
MKPKIIFGLLTILTALNLWARFVSIWPAEKLQAASDLVVIGIPIKTKDLNETNSLGFSSKKLFQSRFRGVETTFKVSEMLKGTSADKIVLHHYREELEWGSPPNGPTLMNFDPNSTNKYVLYLAKDETNTNRYTPVAGQIDAYISIKLLTTNFSWRVNETVTNALN